MGEWLLVAMEPITDFNGYHYVFEVVRVSDGSWLDGNVGNPGIKWGAGHQWVFSRGK